MTFATSFVPRTCAAVVILLATTPGLSFAQQAVPVHEEPRHRLVAEHPRFYILDVQIQPGDTTLFHTHATPIHYVTISASRTNSRTLGRDWPAARGGGSGRGAGTASWVLSYATQPLTHRVTNIGAQLFRLIAVVHRGNAAATPPTVPLPGVIEAESEWFRRARLTLEPDASVLLDGAASPVVAIQVTPGRVEATPGGGAPAFSGVPGEWLLLDSRSGYAIRNAGTGPVSLVLVQVVGS